MRREGGGRYSAGACSGRACEVGRFAESACIGGLVAHRVEDGGAQKTIVASLGEAEGLNEVLLGEPACWRGIVAHPCSEQCCLGHRGEQRAANAFGVFAM